MQKLVPFGPSCCGAYKGEDWSQTDQGAEARDCLVVILTGPLVSTNAERSILPLRGETAPVSLANPCWGPCRICAERLPEGDWALICVP